MEDLKTIESSFMPVSKDYNVNLGFLKSAIILTLEGHKPKGQALKYLSNAPKIYYEVSSAMLKPPRKFNSSPLEETSYPETT